MLFKTIGLLFFISKMFHLNSLNVWEKYMQFISFGFLILLIIVAGMNYVIPRKCRYIWLLIVSFAFYVSIDARYTVVLILSILTTYGAGLLIGKNAERSAGEETKNSSGNANSGTATFVFVACLTLNIALILGFKLAGFLTGGSILAPIGISFYGMKALSYLIDVKRGDIKAEKNLIAYALYVSFFTQIVSGPIERAGNMLSQFYYPVTVDYYRLQDGFYEMLWGYFLKLVLADRLAIFVNRVYDSSASGGIAFLATLFYSFEIYCDFCGYSHIAIGAARLLGIDVMKNFDSPYMSGSVSEFWHRWHISLSSWLRDYVYIPLGGNRKGTARKFFNILVTFAVSGIWHGMGLTFMVWGMLHGLYQILGILLKPVRDRVVSAFKIDRESFAHRAVKVIFTFFLVNTAWIFFRAESLPKAFDILMGSMKFTPWILTDGTIYQYGLNSADIGLLVLGIILLIIVDAVSYRGISIREKMIGLKLPLRWAIIIPAIMIILICGIWGSGYDAASFIYQQF